jgi:TIR domain
MPPVVQPNEAKLLRNRAMAEPPAAPTTGRIFISYRREETAYPAGWLFDRLVARFGDGQVFKDVDSIELGEDFVEAITEAVGSCTVLLALIGDQWLTITDENGTRRIESADDFVRLEIEAALSRDVLVVPVLVDNAEMPNAVDVPPSLAPLTRRQALELSPSRFDFDTSRLLRVLEKTVAEAQLAAPVAEPPRTWRRRLSRRTQVAAAVVAAAIASIAAFVILRPDSPSSGSPPSQGDAIFSDDFSSRANNWNETGGERDGGHYVDGAYRIHTTWAEGHFSDHGFPRNARSVYPTAPRDVRLAVDARQLTGAGQDAGYGIACRADGAQSYYQFAIWQGQAVIAKVIPQEPYYVELRSTAVEPQRANRLEAICTTEEDGQRVRLTFLVNGRQVAHATDRDRPLSSGTVGLLVATGGSSAEEIEAEFDNFVVTSA